ncbi:MAG TPA: leucine-rich repeat domain-containing protein [Verrucomicrobiae bacterium]
MKPRQARYGCSRMFLSAYSIGGTVRSCASGILTLLCAAVPATIQAQFTYTTNNGTISITAWQGPGEAAIPGTINGLPVTAVADFAFSHAKGLTNVIFPTSVTNIGNAAFYGSTDLFSITVNPLNPSYCSADGVLFDKDQARLIKWPPAKAGSCSIPNTVITIADGAFANATSLTNVVIPGSVSNVGVGAFSYCRSLTTIALPNSVSQIGSQAFGWCFNLAGVTMPDTITSIGEEAFAYCRSLTNVTIPQGVISIASGMFLECTDLVAVSIPDSATRIEDAVFGDCGSLANIIIPEGVTTIGAYAFDYCTNLRSLSIPNSVTTLGAHAFFSCTNISAVTLSEALTSIAEGAFADCTALTNLAIPNSVAEIEAWAFSGCSCLTSIRLGSGVTNIGHAAFSYCTSLTNVTIPGNVISINGAGFEGCASLEGVFFEGNAPGVDWDGVFADAIVHFLPGTTGWGTTAPNGWALLPFGGSPARLWNAQAQPSDINFGVRTNRFGFNVRGTVNIPVVIDACEDLGHLVWASVQNCTLTNGALYFGDPEWTNHPRRFYRVRWP